MARNIGKAELKMREKKNAVKDGKTRRKEEKLGLLSPLVGQPWEMARTMYNDVARDFDRSLWYPTWWGNPLLTWMPRSDLENPRFPLIDIRDSDKEIIVEAEMPGIPKDNIDIRLTENSIEICGEKEEREEKEERDKSYYVQERTYLHCFRRMPLPAEIVKAKAYATISNGILRITLPKKNPGLRTKTHLLKVR